MAPQSIVGRFKVCFVVVIVSACGGNVGGGGSSTNATTGAAQSTNAQSNAGGAAANGGSGSGNGSSSGNMNTSGGNASAGAVAAGGSGVTVVGGSGAGGGTSANRTCPACDTTCCAADDCGVIGISGCAGSLVDCGYNNCSPDSCGKTPNGNPGKPNKCSSICLPKTIADCRAEGKNCDSIADGCGGIVSCGTCTAPYTCGGGGITFQCGVEDNCKNFCKLVPTTCPVYTDTVLHGTVWSPAGNPAIDPSRGEVPLPIPNAMIYVPNGSTTPPYGLSEFTDGVALGCDCTIQGSPLAVFPSGVDGSFTVTGVPAGVDIPLVIQLGKWRRVVTIPTSQAPACAGRVELTADQTRLPRRQAERDPMDAIPLMALSTGPVDALECVLRKMGVEDSQFSNGEDSGNGRIRFYRQTSPSTAGSTLGGPGASCTNGGGSCVGTTPSYTSLVANQASVDRYDALLFPCNGGAHDESAQVKSLILDDASNSSAYVNRGGRTFFTHYSYAWLYNQPPSNLLPWPSTSIATLVNTQWDTAYGEIDTSFPRGATFAAWLGLPNVKALTALSPFPYVTLTEARRDLANPATWPFFGSTTVPLYAQRWIYHPTFMTPPDNAGTTVNTLQDSIQLLSFDTPYGQVYGIECGRVVFSSFHVTSAGLSTSACITGTGPSASDTNCSFPAECGTTMQEQEKILAYILFDLTATVCPHTSPCLPLSCADQGIMFGPASDGCGHMLDCGSSPGCVPFSCEVSCANEGIACMTTRDPARPATFYCPKPDGCGASLSCYCNLG